MLLWYLYELNDLNIFNMIQFIEFIYVQIIPLLVSRDLLQLTQPFWHDLLSSLWVSLLFGLINCLGLFCVFLLSLQGALEVALEDHDLGGGVLMVTELGFVSLLLVIFTGQGKDRNQYTTFILILTNEFQDYKLLFT